MEWKQQLESPPEESTLPQILPPDLKT